MNILLLKTGVCYYHKFIVNVLLQKDGVYKDVIAVTVFALLLLVSVIQLVLASFMDQVPASEANVVRDLVCSSLLFNSM